MQLERNEQYPTDIGTGHQHMTHRQRRAAVIWLVLLLVGAAAALVLNAFRSNIVFFFSPSEVTQGGAPRTGAFRLGGLVREGSVVRDDTTLRVSFVVTDRVRDMPVAYAGMLPDLFREGKGVVAQGRLAADGTFVATQVLAKHDENYMPPEARQAIERARAPGAEPGAGSGPAQ